MSAATVAAIVTAEDATGGGTVWRIVACCPRGHTWRGQSLWNTPSDAIRAGVDMVTHGTVCHVCRTPYRDGAAR